MSSRMRGTSLACTRRRITSGLPGSRTLTSGSCAQKPKQPTGASLTSRPPPVDGFGEGVVDALGAVARAAGAHAHSDARPRWDQLRHARLRARR